MLLDDVATYLAAQSTKFSVGATGSVWKSLMLDEGGVPNTVIVLYEQAGTRNSYAFSTGAGVTTLVERPRLQIIARSTSYSTARDRAETAYTILDGLSQALPTSTGTTYHSIEAVQAPFFIGRDESDRFLVSCNYQIEKAVG